MKSVQLLANFFYLFIYFALNYKLINLIENILYKVLIFIYFTTLTKISELKLMAKFKSCGQ